MPEAATITGPLPHGPGTRVSQDKVSFFWTYTEEPHRTRRQAIIKAYPEVGYQMENRVSSGLQIVRSSVYAALSP